MPWYTLRMIDFGFTLKKTITLLVLVDPLLAIPLYLAAVKEITGAAKAAFARTLGITVAVALMIAGVAGSHILSLLGVSMGAMQVGGGAIAFLVAIAMVLAKEEMVKTSDAENAKASHSPGLVPLAIPLLVGPASLSYSMATSTVENAWSFVHILVPALVVGFATWLTFHVANKTGHAVSASTANVVERIGGFLLAAIAIEMMATGLKSLFPVLTGA
jgi:multiple antibiotic resistance protein